MRSKAANATYVGPYSDTTPVEITVVLRRRAGAQTEAAAWPRAPRWPRAQFGRHCGADPADLAAARRFAQLHGLAESGHDIARRVLHLRGAPAALERAFGVRLGRYTLRDGRGPFMGPDRDPVLPPGALAVLGLDRRPVARPHFRRPRAQPSVTYTPLQVARLYSFPTAGTGSGQTIALIELGGGFTASDLAQYFQSLGVSVPHPASPRSASPAAPTSRAVRPTAK